MSKGFWTQVGKTVLNARLNSERSTAQKYCMEAVGKRCKQGNTKNPKRIWSGDGVSSQ